MIKKKKTYSVELQERLLEKAKKIIKKKYFKEPSILAIYLGGSLVNKTFGEGSDIDVMLVIRDIENPVPLPEKNQKHYSVRHIGKTDKVPVYRMVDERVEDVLIFEKHPIEPMIVTKDMFEGWLSGRYTWGDKKSDKYKPFSELAKKFKVLKETKDIEKMREEYDSIR